MPGPQLVVGGRKNNLGLRAGEVRTGTWARRNDRCLGLGVGRKDSVQLPGLAASAMQVQGEGICCSFMYEIHSSSFSIFEASWWALVTPVNEMDMSLPSWSPQNETNNYVILIY